MLTGHRQRGFTLTELMVAGALGLVLLGGIATMLLAIAGAARDAMMQAHLRQTVATVTTIIGSEVRRAGFSNHHRAADSSIGNGHDGFLPVHVADEPPAASCLLYSLDQAAVNVDGVPAVSDQGGLRLANGALQVKTSDEHCGEATCSGCASGHWLAVTDPATVTVTSLGFAVDSDLHLDVSGDHGIETRTVTVTLEAQLVNEPAVQRRVVTVIGLPNDRAW